MMTKNNTKAGTSEVFELGDNYFLAGHLISVTKTGRRELGNN